MLHRFRSAPPLEYRRRDPGAVVTARILALVLVVGGPALHAQGGAGEEAPRQVRVDGSGPSVASLGAAARGMTIVVVDYRGPVAGATIRITNGANTLEGYTNERGTVLLDVRKRGRWQVEVERDGYLPSKGAVPWPAASNLEVELRVVAENRQPAAVEEPSDDAVRAWLAKGSALLTEGKHKEARAELTKALPYLDRAGKSQVRASLARSFWVEGDRVKGLEELQEAIRLDPEAEGPRQVFAALMDAMGRSKEVEARLAVLVKEPPTSVTSGAPPAPGTPRKVLPVPDPQPAQAHVVGPQEVRFPTEHAMADVETVLELLGYVDKDPARQRPIDLAEESFDVFVPETYAGRRAGEKWGLFVWISAGERGGVRGEAVRQLLAERRLIWVGANNSGNPRSYWQRVALALHAAENGQRFWDVDGTRVFVGGYSGGGRTASMAAWLWPEVFRGAIFWMGTDFFEAVPVPYAPGKSWATRFPKPSKAKLRQVRRNSRFAFVTGDLDFNRSETLSTFKLVQRAGFEGMTYLQIPDADHNYGVRAEELGRALSAIDP